MTAERELRNIDEAIENRRRADKRITAPMRDAFKAKTPAEQKIAFEELGNEQQREMLGFLNARELKALREEYTQRQL